MSQLTITKILRCVCCLTLVFTTSISSVCAMATNKEIVVSETFAKENARYGEREEIEVLDVEYETVEVTPEGQPPQGTNFPSGGGLYVNPDKGPMESISIGVGWGVFSTSLAVGNVSTTGSAVGGAFVEFPADNHYYLIVIENEFRIEHHKVDVYQYDEYKYTYYSTPGYLQSRSYRLEQVK